MAAIFEKIRETMTRLSKDLVNAEGPHKADISFVLNSTKYLYAEVERAGLSKTLTEADEVRVIEKVISDNADSIVNFTKLNKLSKAIELELQNRLFEGFLPTYATKEEIVSFLNENGLAEHIGTKNGKSIGAVTKALKEKNVNFKNEVIKEIVFQ